MAGSEHVSSGVAHGSIHGRTKGAAPHLTLAELFPAKSMPGLGHGKHGKGRTKHGKAGVHGRGRLPVDHLPYQARQDPWKHKDQAISKGAVGVKR